MLFKPLPDPAKTTALKDYLWAPQTIVVHDRATEAAYGRHVAPLSLKTVRRGEERYNVHGFFETVAPGDILVINQGQAYASEIDAARPVETLCVFFTPEDERSALQLSLGDHELLDDPCAAGGSIGFASVKSRAPEQLAQLASAAPSMRGADPLQREAYALQLLVALFDHERPSWRAAHDLHATRASTRRELLRRCRIGRAYIEAAFCEEIGVREIAPAAGLSRGHFLRSYAKCFGETPYQTLLRRRMEHASMLLKTRGARVTEAALASGFGNFSAFSRAFKAFFGVPPSVYARSN